MVDKVLELRRECFVAIRFVLYLLRFQSMLANTSTKLFTEDGYHIMLLYTIYTH